jgi:hypothetical protein
MKCYPKMLDLPEKNVPVANTLAYFGPPLVTEKKVLWDWSRLTFISKCWFQQILFSDEKNQFINWKLSGGSKYSNIYIYSHTTTHTHS